MKLDLVLAIASGAAVIICMRVVAQTLKRRSDDLEEFKKHSKRFYDAAAKLVEDDATPGDLLLLLDFLNRELDSPDAAKRLFAAIRQGTGISMSDKARRISASINAFAARRPEIEPLITNAIGSGMLAITYKSQVYGPLCRMSMMPGSAVANRAVSMAESSRYRLDGNGSDGLLTA